MINNICQITLVFSCLILAVGVLLMGYGVFKDTK